MKFVSQKGELEDVCHPARFQTQFTTQQNMILKVWIRFHLRIELNYNKSQGFSEQFQ